MLHLKIVCQNTSIRVLFSPCKQVPRFSENGTWIRSLKDEIRGEVKMCNGKEYETTFVWALGLLNISKDIRTLYVQDSLNSLGLILLYWLYKYWYYKAAASPLCWHGMLMCGKVPWNFLHSWNFFFIPKCVSMRWLDMKYTYYSPILKFCEFVFVCLKGSYIYTGSIYVNVHWRDWI